MKIVDFKTWVVANPPPSFGGRYFVFLKLTTDSGVSGYGECYGATFGGHTMARMIEDVCARDVVGRNPFDSEKLWRDIYSRGFSQRPDISLAGVQSAIDIACWDIVGKELGRPIYDLLGGKAHQRLRSYSYLYPKDGDTTDVYIDPELGAARAVEAVAEGFSAVKFDPADKYSVLDPRQPSLAELDRIEAYVASVRAAVGTRADILVGTHGQFTVSGANRVAQRIEAYDPLWFEEPVPPDMPENMAQVAAKTSIPIATGERLATKYEFARVLQTGAASILQMDLGRVGGIMEAKKIAGMAETYHAQIAPHLYCGPIAGLANIQIATCSPNFLILESIGKWDGFYADLLTTPVTWEAGYVIPPTEPGLGAALNEAVADANPYPDDDDGLHLEMAVELPGLG